MDNWTPNIGEHKGSVRWGVGVVISSCQLSPNVSFSEKNFQLQVIHWKICFDIFWRLVGKHASLNPRPCSALSLVTVNHQM